MSGEDSKSNNDMASMMEAMRSMFGEVRDNMNNLDQRINSNMNNLDQRINSDMKASMGSLREDLAISMSHLREDLNGNIMQSSEQIHMRMESLQERMNSRANSKANSRAVSPGANARIKEEPIGRVDLVMETPRAFAPEEEISMTAIIKNNEDAEKFSQANPLS